MVALCTTGALSQALTTDLVGSGALDGSLTRLSAAVTATGVLSYAAAAYSFEALGAQWLFGAGSSLGLAAAVLSGLLSWLIRPSAGAHAARPRERLRARFAPGRREIP